MDEKGTEAAAGIAVVIVETSVPVIPVVNVNRPFLFVIRDHKPNKVFCLWGRCGLVVIGRHCVIGHGCFWFALVRPSFLKMLQVVSRKSQVVSHIPFFREMTRGSITFKMAGFGDVFSRHCPAPL
ncbi:MAG: hypothetical protein L6Q97_05465 [Thermoanaerobaculia bacterium]|nr:hypothetical protein [Thermoanaerobaculia bacterium]